MPVKTGDQLDQGTVLRTDQTTSASLGFGLNEATSLNWDNLQRTVNHAMWQLNVTK